MFSRLIKWETIKRTLIFFFFFVFGLTVIGLVSNIDLRNKVLTNGTNQQTIKIAEYKYREKIISTLSTLEFDSLKNSINKVFPDSTQVSNNLQKLINLQLVDKLKDTTFSLKKNISWFYDSPITFDSLSITFKINQEKFTDIITTDKSNNQTTELLKFGDYIDQEIKSKDKIKIDLFLIALLVSYLFALFNQYWFSKKRERFTKNYKEEFIEKIKEKISLLPIEDSKKKNYIEVEIHAFKELISEYEDLKMNKEVISLLSEDYLGFKKQSDEIYERSSLFLSFSFLISIFGIVIFFLLLPPYNPGYKINEYLGISIRTLFILLFLQSLSFYLLRQYKSSINDYRFFYNEMNNKKNLLSAYEILKNKDGEKINSIIAMEILRSCKSDSNYNLKINEGENTDDKTYSAYLKIIDALKK